jgi:excisionase family DNA binding protein
MQILTSPSAPLRTRAIAIELDVHPATVRRWIASGALPAVRVGGELRVEREDLERFIRPVARESES